MNALKIQRDELANLSVVAERQRYARIRYDRVLSRHELNIRAQLGFDKVAARIASSSITTTSSTRVKPPHFGQTLVI